MPSFDAMVHALHQRMFQPVVTTNCGQYRGSTAQAPYRRKRYDKVIAHVHGAGQVAVSGQEQPPRYPKAGTAKRGTAAAWEVGTGRRSQRLSNFLVWPRSRPWDKSCRRHRSLHTCAGPGCMSRMRWCSTHVRGWGVTLSAEAQVKTCPSCFRLPDTQCPILAQIPHRAPCRDRIS